MWEGKAVGHPAEDISDAEKNLPNLSAEIAQLLPIHCYYSTCHQYANVISCFSLSAQKKI